VSVPSGRQIFLSWGYDAPVAAVTAPGARRSLIGAVLSAASGRARAKGRVPRLAAAVQENVMTFAALAAADFGAFHISHGWGWAAIGVSVLLADFKIQG
jgi:hypothetical protein